MRERKRERERERKREWQSKKESGGMGGDREKNIVGETSRDGFNLRRPWWFSGLIYTGSR